MFHNYDVTSLENIHSVTVFESMQSAVKINMFF